VNPDVLRLLADEYDTPPALASLGTPDPPRVLQRFFLLLLLQCGKPENVLLRLRRVDAKAMLGDARFWHLTTAIRAMCHDDGLDQIVYWLPGARSMDSQ
jgi:hypothetical protein